MKTFSMKSLALMTGMLLTLSFAVSPASYSQDGANGKKTGFETGKHLGHDKDNGLRKGHENERNPWYGAGGVDFVLTVYNHGTDPVAISPGTYNSAMTVQELIVEILPSDLPPEYIAWFVLQRCFDDCSGDETTAPLDGALTLEQAGLVEDPVVHLAVSLR